MGESQEEACFKISEWNVSCMDFCSRAPSKVIISGVTQNKGRGHN